MHEAMTARQILDFYTSFYKAVQREQAYANKPVRINTPFMHGVEVYRGIELLAAEAGARLERDATAKRIRFTHKGVCFYQKVRT